MKVVHRKLKIEFTRPSKGFAPLSRAIRFIEGTPYSHVRLKWETGQGDDIVYEASGISIKFLGEKAQKARPVDVICSYSIDLSKDEYKALLYLCLSNAGLDYGFGQLIGILLHKLFSTNVNILSKGSNAQVCSEVVGRFLQDVIGIGREMDLDLVGPKDIQYMLEKHSTNKTI